MESISDCGKNDVIHYGLAGVYFDKTEITDICGAQCKLRYRGYEIDELAIDPNYEKVAYLILYGEWPSALEFQEFRASLAARRELSGEIIDLLNKLIDVPPMAALRTAMSYIGAIHTIRPADITEDQDTHSLDLIGMIPSLIVVHNALRQGRTIPDPDSTLDHASDFLHRLTGRQLSPLEQRLINLDFVLHADHGANASTFVARTITSTEADVFSAISAAIGAFSGRAHGGALEGVIEMLDTLESADVVSQYIQQELASGRAIMGFGHRVYRGEDPRTPHFRDAAKTLSIQLGDFTLLDKLNALVAAMEPHKRVGIGPNADLYAALVYRLLGIADDLSTAIFTAGRTVGWVAQVLEQKSHNILIRPRLQYVGPRERTLHPVHRGEIPCDESYPISTTSTH